MTHQINRVAVLGAGTMGAGEQASRQGHRVADSKGGLVRSEGEELLPEVFLEPPEVGSLAGKGGPVHLAESGEPLRVVPAEEEVDVLVGVYAEELADNLYGEYLCIGELGGGAALADTPFFEPVVHQAEDCDDEGVKIHRKWICNGSVDTFSL